MKHTVLLLASACAVLLSAAPVLAICSPDSVQVGPLCVDRYEESVWEIPATSPQGKSNAGLISKVRDGKATLANLQAGGASSAAPPATTTGVAARIPATAVRTSTPCPLLG